MNFDKIITNRPINKIAAFVTGKGFDYKTKFKEPDPSRIYNSDMPPALRNDQELMSILKNTVDLRGLTVGRLKVIGYAKHTNRWAVKCSCGKYEVRSTKSLRKLKHSEDMCYRCNQQNYLVRHYKDLKYFEKHGYWPHQKESKL